MRANRTGQVVARAWLGAGFVFLYLPIVALVLYSFNDSPIPNVWAGFTLKWYAALPGDREIISGLWLSLQIAFFTACGSVVLGTLAAFALVKYKRFGGRTLFNGMVNAPLVMPEVIVGLSLLLMLVSVQRALGFPERGMLTIWLGHLLLGMAYATVVVQARLQDLNPQLEEAAMDLGARPSRVFFLITLPIIFPALLSGWLLALTLSLDDLVITSFVAGPGSSTLPMVIFSKVRLGVSPDINALATILVTIVAIGAVIAGIVQNRRQQERERDAQMALAANQQMIESLKKG
jgi:putrescine transport system permease protein